MLASAASHSSDGAAEAAAKAADIQRLMPDDIAAAFGGPISPYVADRVRTYDLAYRTLGRAERDHHLLGLVDAVYNRELVRAGEARIGQWEAGWGAHVAAIGPDFDRSQLVPGYFGKFPIVRWRQDLVAPLRHHFEYRSFAVIQDWLFDRYLRGASHVYEFGCGTGHNLFRVRDVNPDAELWGLDWTEASQSILGRLNAAGIDRRLNGRRFDFFNPDRDFRLAPGAAIYTAAALEQTGDRFLPFVDYLLCNRPSLCIHIEPIAELLDPGHLLDSLSIAYFRRRNYLSGFLAYLRALERDGRVAIHMARRSFIGSLYIDGYSVIVWSPVGGAA